MRKRLCSRLLTCALLCAGGSGTLRADIFQSAMVSQTLSGTNTIQSDMAKTQGTGLITQDILAEIPKGGDTSATAAAVASVGRFGDVGLTAADFSNVNSMTDAFVSISSDEFLNATSLTEHVFSNVLIDGGLLRIFQGQRIPNSSISYTYDLIAFTSQGTSTFPIQTFCSSGMLATDQTGINASFDPKGGGGCGGLDHFVDFHATFDPSTWTVTIPPSFHTFDLGQLVPLDSMTLDYSFEFTLSHGPQAGQASELYAQFGDPLHLSGNSALGSVTFAPATATSPEPDTLISLGCGLAILTIARRLSRRVGRMSTSARDLQVALFPRHNSLGVSSSQAGGSAKS